MGDRIRTKGEGGEEAQEEQSCGMIPPSVSPLFATSVLKLPNILIFVAKGIFELQSAAAWPLTRL
jgi:hypothetical protein